ncbi:hypothetical protein [Nocardia sp. NPDC058497]|uniref:hypothetical protein n=1 Tax=Nocardia sp. NPDC058497 TaxID=3346529 RepID=UPI0036663789
MVPASHQWARHRLGSARTPAHSGLTHLGESGASLPELMAKSRHRKAENLRRYFKPSPQAMRELTSLIGPGTSAPTDSEAIRVFCHFVTDPVNRHTA